MSQTFFTADQHYGHAAIIRFCNRQLFRHSRGTLEPIGLQWDAGVDNNDFYPVSFERIKELMEARILAGEGQIPGSRK